MKRSKWDERMRRADQLARAHPFAAEVLQFYTRITSFQQALYADLESSCGDAKRARTEGVLRDELDLFILLPKFPQFLALVETIAPAPLAHSAAELIAQGAQRWQELLQACWADSESQPSSAEAVLSRLFLQPYAEFLADYTQKPTSGRVQPLCPVCGSRPQAGILRPEGDGGKRSLICSLCANEWEFRRLLCPSCGEENVEKLVIYTADQFQHVRIEACDSCHHYIKTIDLTKNGNAVPVVDELAAIPLSLWAEEHGYSKLQTNLLGI
ncbi:MAG TPA: formate dehydrogenase accessory protein FdhE [Terriglobales bacterium]|nr:formate dehydrogenase accessory protein FdhE [Terriglobales bacterium]